MQRLRECPGCSEMGVDWKFADVCRNKQQGKGNRAAGGVVVEALGCMSSRMAERSRQHVWSLWARILRLKH